MRDLDTKDLERVLVATLDGFREQLLEVAAMSRVNAMLSMAESAFLLPSPAVSLMQVTAPASHRLGETTVFRSMEPLGTDGDVFFTPIDPDSVVHPWRAESSEWIEMVEPGEPISTPSREVRGLRIVLRRASGTVVSTDWLSLYVDGDPHLQKSLRQGHIYVSGKLLEARPQRLYFDGKCCYPGSPGSVQYHLESLTRNLVQIRLPADIAANEHVVLEIRYEDRMPLLGEARSPRVHTNVFPVWNSRDHVYPEPSDVEQSVTESLQRIVHPLTTRDLGTGWQAWAIQFAGAADSTKVRFKPSSAEVEVGNGSADDSFDVALAPIPKRDIRFRATESCVLAVVLSQATRARLDHRQQRLGVRFRATTGASANAIPAGSEFQLVEVSGMPLGERVTGQLVCNSWGGTDGLAGALLGDPDANRIHALLPRRTRSIGDVVHIVDRLFGSELALVDERDLLRPAACDVRQPLLVRVTFRQPSRDRLTKRVLLESCASFLERYLEANHVGGIRLVEGAGAVQ